MNQFNLFFTIILQLNTKISILKGYFVFFRLEEPSSIRSSDIDEEKVRLTDGSRNIAVLEGRKTAVSASVLRRELVLLKVCKQIISD